ncbi:3-isopropylmalate dehydratase/homoaconitate hydratase family large subunit [Methanofollis fontis]|uniref:3-isopropylmalate dehydratase large subunit n=1 Tax=Methanofollis fontis TaxID=2052832 RepID=A0A483CPY8_9EURY|nr:3-isopropylmalate dehydratase/homoaconitate hydratase family large subunit [Methanofollis fontis]TAJ45205.1 3-isopropylmalate dehydratase large subunit [Methanofollis fontis]
MNTLSEEILGAPAGSYVDRPVDRAYVHDGTGVLARAAWEEIGTGRFTDPDRKYLIFDHIVPANTSVTADLQHELRAFARRTGMQFHDVGSGVCHQVMAEGRALPGEVIVGADSHTCTLGAFGAFATGVGATDMAGIWATGETWFLVPETTGVLFEGELSGGAEAKDVALAVVGALGMDGATYRALEFAGEGAASLSIADRLTLCNMAVETGAKTGMFRSDAVTRAYLASFGLDTPLQPGGTQRYSAEISIDLSAQEPLLALPPRVDTVCPVAEKEGLSVDQVFLGTCTGGRYQDLERFAAIVRGKTVAVRTVVVPASRAVLLRAAATGVLSDLVEAGCAVATPGCGPCLGAHMGVIGEGEVCLSTANRNFRNRMGVGGEIYLASPSTAAATALAGAICSPEGCQ